MHTYHFVALEVEPKRVALKQATAELNEVQGKLEVLQAGLKELMDRLAKLDADFNASVDKKNALAAKAEECTVKMDRADRLLGGLGGEKVRWQETVVRLGERLECVVGDVIVAAGGIAYLGAFVATYREEAEAFWQRQLTHYGIASTPGGCLPYMSALYVCLMCLSDALLHRVDARRGAAEHARRPRGDPGVEHRGLADRCPVDRERHHPLQVVAVVLYD